MAPVSVNDQLTNDSSTAAKAKSVHVAHILIDHLKYSIYNAFLTAHCLELIIQ